MRRRVSMPGIVLTDEEMRYIALFEEFTGVVVKDCIIDRERNRIIFVVKEGQVGKAVGRSGSRIKMLNKLLNKSVEVVEYSDNLEDMIRKSLFPARVNAIKVAKTANGKKVVIVSVPPSDKGIAIGRDGRNVSRARILAKRYFGIDKVMIA